MIALVWGAVATAQDAEEAPNPWIEATEEEEKEEEAPAPEPEPEPEFEPLPHFPTREPPQPPKVQLSVVAGSLHNGDDAWRLFADRSSMPSWGGRIGYRVRPRIELVAGWQHIRRGAEIVAPPPTAPDADFEADNTRFVAAFDGDEITLGPRVDVSIAGAFLPYLQVQGMAFRGLVRLDDDPDTASNPGQVRAQGLTGGVLAMGGAEIRLPPESAVAVSWHLELGYGWLARLDLGELGGMSPGGFAVRTGFGVHF